MKFCEENEKIYVFAISYGVLPPAAGHSQPAVTLPPRTYTSCAVLS